MTRKLSLNQLCSGRHNSNVVLASFRDYAESGASIGEDAAMLAIKRQWDNLSDENLAELKRILFVGAMTHGKKTCYAENHQERLEAAHYAIVASYVDDRLARNPKFKFKA